MSFKRKEIQQNCLKFGCTKCLVSLVTLLFCPTFIIYLTPYNWYRVPRGLMVIAVGFWIYWLERTRVQTLVLELNWSELEVVVAGEGGHSVGRVPPFCLVCARNSIPQPDSTWMTGQQRSGRRCIVALDSPGEEAASVHIWLYIC